MKKEEYCKTINLEGVESKRTYLLTYNEGVLEPLHIIDKPKSLKVHPDNTHVLYDEENRQHIITDDDWFAFYANTYHNDFSFNVSDYETENEWQIPENNVLTVDLTNVSFLLALTLTNVEKFLIKKSGSLQVVLNNGTIIYFNKKFLK